MVIYRQKLIPRKHPGKEKGTGQSRKKETKKNRPKMGVKYTKNSPTRGVRSSKKGHTKVVGGGEIEKSWKSQLKWG